MGFGVEEAVAGRGRCEVSTSQSWAYSPPGIGCSAPPGIGCKRVRRGALVESLSSGAVTRSALTKVSRSVVGIGRLS